MFYNNYFYFKYFKLFCFKKRYKEFIIENNKKEEVHKKELETKRNNYSELQNEMNEVHVKMKELKLKHVDTIRKLNSSVAEFFTLQQITQGIISILDVNDLVTHVNDIIIGVMGVSNSSIIFYDENTKKL